jgi:hypothetical protein
MAFVFCPTTQLWAEDKEPFAVVELGAATERSLQEGTVSAGPSASVEFPIIKDWLEIEAGISPHSVPITPNGKPIYFSRSRSRSTSTLSS